MLLDVDHASGTVRLDDEGFAALVEAAGSGSATAHPEALTAIASGGLDAVMGAVLRPAVSLELLVAGTTVRQLHRAWVDAGTAALLLAVRPGVDQLLGCPPAFLTAALVRLTRIRPRRTHTRTSVAFPDERLPELVATDPVVRGAALADAGGELAWQLDLSWPGGSRRVVAVDGPAGVRVADPGGGRLLGASNTTIYRILSTALPATAL